MLLNHADAKRIVQRCLPSVQLVSLRSRYLLHCAGRTWIDHKVELYAYMNGDILMRNNGRWKEQRH